jgi:Flp pilus assembly pilin Flp
MYSVIELCSRFRWFVRRDKHGQTMTEYALIMAAIAIVVYVAYQTLGQDITTLVNQIGVKLTTAPPGG